MKLACSLLSMMFAALGLATQDQTFSNTSRANVLYGTINADGIEQSWKLVFTKDRFRTAVIGDVPESIGIMGTTGWAQRGGSMPHILSGVDLDVKRLDQLVQTGRWIKLYSTGTVKTINTNTKTLQVGQVTATIFLDPITHLARSANYISPFGLVLWSFEDYKPYRNAFGLKFAAKSIRTCGNQKAVFSVKYQSCEDAPLESFSVPVVASNSAKFDGAVSTRVAAKWVNGIPLVNPLVNGKHRGWFILDSGCDGMIVDSQIAEECGAKFIGNRDIMGVGGSQEGRIAKGLDIKIGPVTIPAAVYDTLDLSGISDSLGLPLAGIAGYDFFSRASVTLDPGINEISVSAPGSIALPKGFTWLPFELQGDVPVIQCPFPDENFSGRFAIATGSTGPINIFEPTTTRLQIRHPRFEREEMFYQLWTPPEHVKGIGDQSVHSSQRLSQFTLGSTILKGKLVHYQFAKSGLFANPYLTGNIGMSILWDFEIVFDYQNSRVALRHIGVP